MYLVIGALVAGLWVILDAADANDSAQWTAVSGVLTVIAVRGLSLLATESLQLRVLVWNAVAIVLAIGTTGLVLRTVQDRHLSTHGWLGGGSSLRTSSTQRPLGSDSNASGRSNGTRSPQQCWILWKLLVKLIVVFAPVREALGA